MFGGAPDGLPASVLTFVLEPDCHGARVPAAKRVSAHSQKTRRVKMRERRRTRPRWHNEDDYAQVVFLGQGVALLSCRVGCLTV